MKATIYQVTRRDFLRQAGVGAGALVLGCSISTQADGLPSVRELIHGIPVPAIPFVALKLNGDVVIITHRAEMGQGIRTSLAAVLADEMEADWKRVSLRQAPADTTRFGLPFPYPVPPEAELPYPFDKPRGAEPLFAVDADRVLRIHGAEEGLGPHRRDRLRSDRGGRAADPGGRPRSGQRHRRRGRASYPRDPVLRKSSGALSREAP